MSQNNTIRHILFYSGTVVFCKLMGASMYFFIAHFLSPSEFGILVTLLTIYMLTPIVLLGTLETFLKKYSFFSGKNQHLESTLLEQHTLGSIWIAAGILLACELVLEAAGINHIVSINIFYIRMITLSSILSLFSNFYYFRFTARQKFGFVSLIELLRSVFSFLFIPILAYFWGIKGAMYGFLFHEIAVMSCSLLLSNRNIGAVSVVVKYSAYLDLVKTGLPISIIWWTYMVQSSIDKFFTVTFIGQEAAGSYGLGARFISMLILIPLAIGRILYPKVNCEIGKNNLVQGFNKYVLFPSKAISLLVAPCICSSVIILPIIYQTFFLKYADGVKSAQILLVSCYFICMNRTGINYLISLNKQSKIMFAILICLLVNILLSYLFTVSGFGITGIALARIISLVLFSLWIWYSVFVFSGIRWISRVNRLFVLYTPLLIALLIIFIFNKITTPFFSEQNLFTLIYAAFCPFVCFFSSLLIKPFKSTLKDIIYAVNFFPKK